MHNIRLSFNVAELKELVRSTSGAHNTRKLHTKLKLAEIKLSTLSGQVTEPTDINTVQPVSMNERRKQDYDKWLAAVETCTDTEEKNAKQYMYDNGLMTEEEAEQWEAAIFGE